MQIRRSAFGIEVLAPAKVNIFFEVLSRRDDGFHEIESLMVPVGMYDTLILEDDPTGEISLAARWSKGFGCQPLAEGGHRSAFTHQFGDLPEAENNLALRAIRLLAEHAGINRGAKLRLIKRIPAAAGLGGGSSDAAAALLAANIAWKLYWPLARLMSVAADLGSDVPFFLVCRPAICRGRGEKIKRVVGLPVLHFVVVRPPEGLATARVYQACQPGSPPRQVSDTIAALSRGNLTAIGLIAHNRLLESARSQSVWIEKVMKQLEGENCPAIGMSGSGSSCFALCRTAAHSRSVAARLRNRRPNLGQVWFVSSV